MGQDDHCIFLLSCEQDSQCLSYTLFVCIYPLFTISLCIFVLRTEHSDKHLVARQNCALLERNLMRVVIYKLIYVVCFKSVQRIHVVKLVRDKG